MGARIRSRSERRPRGVWKRTAAAPGHDRHVSALPAQRRSRIHGRGAAADDHDLLAFELRVAAVLGAMAAERRRKRLRGRRALRIALDADGTDDAAGGDASAVGKFGCEAIAVAPHGDRFAFLERGHVPALEGATVSDTNVSFRTGTPVSA